MVDNGQIDLQNDIYFLSRCICDRRMVRERSRKEATQPLDHSAVSRTGAIERAEYMLGMHPLLSSSLLWPQKSSEYSIMAV